jgi:hypothetical protein
MELQPQYSIALEQQLVQSLAKMEQRLFYLLEKMARLEARIKALETQEL